MAQWGVYQVGPNAHVIPHMDTVGHEMTHHCICHVKWKAVANPQTHTIVWVFTHSSLDGRENHE